MKNDDDQKNDNNAQDDQVTDDMVPHKGEEVSDLEALEKELEQLKLDQENLTAQLKRAIADYHNLEKRVSEGKAEFFSWATGELLQKILPVLDHLEKALEGASDDDKKSGWFKGVEISVKQLRDVLRNEGLEQIETDGQFDPTLHEAVDTREGDDNKILEVTRRGYNLNGKILRPAQVVVGRKN